MLIMQKVVDSIGELLKIFPHVKALETGTIRSFTEKHESTKHIAKTLGEKGDLISIDSSQKAIEISKKICNGLNNIKWVNSNSIDYLKSLNNEVYHFVLLDSANNPEIIWNEFELVAPRMITNSILMVDDAGITKEGKKDATGAKKGYLVWDKLSKVVPIKIVSSPHGTQLKIVFNKKNKNKILGRLT